jgi:dodecin
MRSRESALETKFASVFRSQLIEKRSKQWEVTMSVARVTQITASSPKGFDDAVRSGIERANRTVRGISGLHVVEQKAKVEHGKVAEYRVTMDVTFILDD